MSRLAAACLVVACFVVACLAPALAGSALAQSTPPASHRPPPIPGTLDPATGKFTPDAAVQGSGSSNNVDKGSIYLGFDLDASHLDSVSVACTISVKYTAEIQPSGELIDAGGTRIGPLDLTYDASSHKFTDIVTFSYEIRQGIFPQDDHVAIAVICRYTFDPETVVFTWIDGGLVDDFTRSLPPVTVKGVMNGHHLG